MAYIVCHPLEMCLHVPQFLQLSRCLRANVLLTQNPLKISKHHMKTCTTLIIWQNFYFCSFLFCVGDPAKLHIQIRDFDVDMQSLETLSLQELRALCEKCDIPVTSNKSQVHAFAEMNTVKTCV